MTKGDTTFSECCLCGLICHAWIFCYRLDAKCFIFIFHWNVLVGFCLAEKDLEFIKNFKIHIRIYKLAISLPLWLPLLWQEHLNSNKITFSLVFWSKYHSYNSSRNLLKNKISTNYQNYVGENANNFLFFPIMSTCVVEG